MAQVRLFVHGDVFILEDNAERIAWFRQQLPSATIVETVADAKAVLETKTFDVYFLDRDLGGQVYTADANSGHEIAQWLAAHGNAGDNVVIHSWNAPGAQRMNALLPHARRQRFGTFTIEVR